ncbi:MAG: hypothetical protein ABID87_09845 [Chloroflexota bacterium]
MYPQLKSNTFEIDEDIDVINDYMDTHGWGDGLPVVPPTPERVSRMIAASGLAPDHVVAEVQPLDGVATIEKIAVNAVMAGCRPEYMPVVVAAVAAMCEPQFNLQGIQATTNPTGVCVVVNGPIRKKLNINCGRNCLGPGWRANATIGRAIRLIQLNIGGGKPEEIDKASQGYPGKYTMCFGENEEDSAWKPLHVERGFKAAESTVTVVSVCSTLNSLTAAIPNLPEYIKDMLLLMANAMSVQGTNNVLLGGGEPIVLLTPGHARLAQEAGLSKADVKQFLYDSCGFPEEKIPRDIMRRERMNVIIKNGIVRPVRRPEDILIIVAGGPEPYHFTFMPTFGDSLAVTRPIL